eukprot:TRINITY_DN3023_c1_g1_i5.p1 TRINITY_DN3023_c1_g1~~TRINITY_DN3023_c1_g1_i5.p1  ORF type:complete len:638 (+),score=150.23 TRINITY_DN3023_c1_g1_i5:204-2117(+)
MSENDFTHRARANEADAVFMLSNRLSDHPEQDDTANVFRALAAQKFAPDVKLFISLHNSACRSLLPESLVESSCIFTQQSQMDVLAISSLVPAFSTLLYALSRTHHCPDDQTNASHPVVQSFLSGADNEFYVLRSGSSTENMNLGDLSVNLFKSFGIILVAFICHECKQVVFDLNSFIPQSSKLLIIAPDRTVASIAVNSGFFEEDDDQTDLELSAPRQGARKGCGHVVRQSNVRRDSLFNVHGALELKPLPLEFRTGHVIFICASTSGLSDFIRRYRVVERSHVDLHPFEDSKQEPATIVVVCPEHKIQSTDFVHMTNDELKGVYFYKKEMLTDIDFRTCKVEEAKSILIVNMEKQKIVGSIENDLVEVSNILMWTRLKRYLRSWRKAVKQDRSGSFQPSRSFHRKPYIITELYSESALTYIQTSISKKKNSAIAQTISTLRTSSTSVVSEDEHQPEKAEKSKWWTTLHDALFQDTKPIHEEIWVSPIFASGMMYFHNLPDLVLSHSFLNSGFLNFINTLLSKCGEHFTLSYEPVARFLDDFKQEAENEEEEVKDSPEALAAPTMGYLFSYLVGEAKLPLALYRNVSHESCSCSSGKVDVEREAWVQAGFKEYLLICPKPEVALCREDHVMVLQEI